MNPEFRRWQRMVSGIFAVCAIILIAISVFPAQLGFMRENDYFSLNDYGIQRRTPLIVGILFLIPVVLFFRRGIWAFWQRMKLPDALAYDPTTSLRRDIAREWRILLLLGAITVFVHVPLWGAYPLSPGRDADSWIGGYIDMVERDIPMNFVSTRMPVAPLFYGTLLATGGISLTTLGCMLLIISAVWMIYLVVRPIGKIAAWGAVLLYLLNLPLQVTFHAVGSEALTLWTALLCVWMLRYAVSSRRGWHWFGFGVAVALACLTRQAGLAFAGAGILIWLNISPLTQKFRNSLMLALGIAVLLLPYVLYRGVHYGSFSLARGNWLMYHHVTRNFNLVQPQNGAASRQLADAVEKYLLTQPAYTRDAITLQDFFNFPEQGVFFTDTLYLSDVILGWETDYALLNAAAWEAIRAYPGVFIRNTLVGIWVTLTDASELPPPPKLTDIVYLPAEEMTPEERRDAAARAALSLGGISLTIYARPPQFPAPTQAEIDAYLARVQQFLAPLYAQVGHAEYTALFKIIGSWYPPMLVLYGLAVLGLLRQGWHTGITWFLLCGAAVAIIAFNTLAGDIWWYRLPYEPIFILAAVPILQSLWQAVRLMLKIQADNL